MSSPQQTVLEKYVDEIILLDPPIEEMEYMANNNPVSFVLYFFVSHLLH